MTREPMTEQEETEANYFAMLLLMPEEIVREQVAKMGEKIDFADDLQVGALAKSFGVGIALMTMRLAQIYGTRP